MKKIDVSTKTYPNQFALVDDDDYENLSIFRWRASKYANLFYVTRTIRRADGKQTLGLMHRMVLGAEKGIHVDHINHNGLDNRKSNIRLCTNAENQRNARPQRGTSSEYKGVYWRKAKSRWCAVITISQKPLWLGTYKIELDAALAYNEAAKKYFGEFAYLNIVPTEV